MVVAGFITAAMINRSLGPSTRGIYAEMQTWMGLFAVIFGMSIDTAIYHFANKALYGTDDRARFVTTFSLSLFCGILASGALTAFVYVWPEQVSSVTYKYIFLLDFLLVATILMGNLIICLQALGEIRYSAAIGVVQGITNLLVIGYVYVAELLNIKTVLLSLLLVQCATCLLLSKRFSKHTFGSGGLSLDLAKRMVFAGFKQHIATVATFVYTKINQLVVFRYCGESEAGIFAVSLSAAFSLMFIPMTLQIVLYPRIIHGADEYEVTIKSLRFGFYVWGGIVMSMVVFAKPILLLYAGKEFLPAINTFRILMLAAWFLPLSSLVAPYCTKVGAFYAMSFSAVFLGAISIVLNILLVPSYLGIGAALSTLTTTCTGFSVALILLWVLSKKNPLEFMKVRIPL